MFFLSHISCEVPVKSGKNQSGPALLQFDLAQETHSGATFATYTISLCIIQSFCSDASKIRCFLL